MPALNVSSRSSDWRARALSNFSAHAFILDGERLSSVEGFVQGIKFPWGHPTRQLAFYAVGRDAKLLGADALRKYVWWKGYTIRYGSREHHRLIERAIRAKFEQDQGALDALLATEGLELAHDLGRPESPHTSLPAHTFCDILTRIREEQLKARK